MVGKYTPLIEVWGKEMNICWTIRYLSKDRETVSSDSIELGDDSKTVQHKGGRGFLLCSPPSFTIDHHSALTFRLCPLRDGSNERAQWGNGGACWPLLGLADQQQNSTRCPGVQKERLQCPAEQRQCPKFPVPAEQPWHLQGLAIPSGAAAPPRANMGLSKTAT